jgi:uncharacterized protein involved in outer membrane biogenesis
MKITCPFCQRTFKDTLVEGSVQCPKCKEFFNVSPKQVRLKLELDVTINAEGENPDSFIDRLNLAASNIINNGMITGDSPATLETFSWSVKIGEKGKIITR